jgi:hypothetical protein
MDDGPCDTEKEDTLRVMDLESRGVLAPLFAALLCPLLSPSLEPREL